MGAAYRAKYVHYLSIRKEEEHLKKTPEATNTSNCLETISDYSDFIRYYIPDHLRCICLPSRDSDEVYQPMIARYRDMACLLQRNL